MEKEVNWVDDYLSGFFAKKKYGINLVVKEITNDKALESFLEKVMMRLKPQRIGVNSKNVWLP